MSNDQCPMHEEKQIVARRRSLVLGHWSLVILLASPVTARGVTVTGRQVTTCEGGVCAATVTLPSGYQYDRVDLIRTRSRRARELERQGYVLAGPVHINGRVFERHWHLPGACGLCDRSRSPSGGSDATSSHRDLATPQAAAPTAPPLPQTLPTFQEPKTEPAAEASTYQEPPPVPADRRFDLPFVPVRITRPAASPAVASSAESTPRSRLHEFVADRVDNLGDLAIGAMIAALGLGGWKAVVARRVAKRVGGRVVERVVERHQQPEPPPPPLNRDPQGSAAFDQQGEQKKN